MVTHQISLCDMPEDIMRKLISESDFKSVLTLRKVCSSLRNFIDDLPEKFLPNTEFSRIQIFARDNGILLKFDSKRSIDVIQYQMNENGWCDRMHDKRITVLKNVDFETIAVEDLEKVLKFQKSALQSATFSLDFVRPTWFPAKLERILKSKSLKTQNLKIYASTQAHVMNVFPYMDSQILKRIWIDQPFGAQANIKMKMDQIVETEQWKNADEIKITSFEFLEPLEKLMHFCVVDIQLGSIGMEDLEYLKTNLSISPKFANFHASYTELTNSDELQRLWGYWSYDRETEERKWFFKIPNSEGIMEIRNKSSEGFQYFVFSRIQFGSLPYLARIILAIISFLMNGLLIFLIITKSPKNMGTYRYLMVFMSSFELLYAIIDLLIQPEVVTLNFVWLSMTSSKRSFLPLKIAYPLLLIWGGSFGIALASFGMHFVYRYFIITGNKEWTTGKLMTLLWIGVPILSGFVFVFAIYFFWSLSDGMDQLVRTKLSSTEGVPPNQFLYFSSYLFKTVPTSMETQLDWMQIFGIAFLCSTVTLSFFTMIFFGLKTYSAMRKFQDSTSTDSSATKTLQTQLFYSLVVQTIIPVILIHFPTTLIYISSFFNSALPVFGKWVTVTIAMFPAIDPLPSLIIIKPYRQALKGWFKKPAATTSVDPSNRATSTFNNKIVTF